MINLTDTPLRSSSPKKLLLIEDDASVVASLNLLLKSEYEVHAESTVASGVRRFRDLSPSLVVLDLRLPDGEGLEVLREIRRADPLTPVVVLTGYASLRTVEESLRLGASDYLHKPFDGFALKSRLAQLVPPQEEPQGNKEPEMFQREELDVDALKLKADASSMFLHDVAGPMSTALTTAHYLCEIIEERHPEDKDTLEMVELLMNSMGFLSGLFEQSRSIESLSRLPVSLLKISKIVDLARVLIHSKAKEAEVPVGVTLDNPEATIRVNRFAMARILVNLLQNAIEAVQSVPEAKVTLSTHCTPTHVEFAVADNGPGIAPELQERIFEARFTTKTHGTGLGLHIAKLLVTNMGGHLLLQSTPGRGCCFSIRIPLAL